MSRLSFYLTKLFVFETLALTTVVVMLLYLVQSLRMFDLVSAKGQDLLTLAGQAALVMPAVSDVFLYVCIGIGLVRALRALQNTRQMQVIHVSRRLSGLLAAIVLYSVLWALFVLSLSNYFGPEADQRRFAWSASIAVDLVGRGLVPHRFAEIVPGVTMVIGGRQGIGEITDFFADDRRDPERRQTFSASSALIMQADNRYILQLNDGKAQYLTAAGEFSEISFERYDLSLDLFTEAESGGDNAKTTFQLIDEADAAGAPWSPALLYQLADRAAEGLRVIGICLMVAAMALFPHGRRRRFEVPMELVVLLIGFVDRAVSSSVPGDIWWGPLTGPGGMIALGLGILLWRLRPRRAKLFKPKPRAVREALA